MKKESILVGVVGLFVGVGITWAIATLAVNNNNIGVMKIMGMHTDSDDMMNNDDMSMSRMIDNLEDKTGEEFDKAFIAEMITHHQGAIDMANLAKTNAGHQEIKDMATAIITAQSQEIDQMQTWQSEWGYKDAPTSHDAMDMSE